MAIANKLDLKVTSTDNAMRPFAIIVGCGTGDFFWKETSHPDSRDSLSKAGWDR